MGQRGRVASGLFKSSLLWILLASGSAFAYDKLVFDSEETERELSFPEEGCQPLLDDDANYEVTIQSPKTIIVRSKGRSLQSALLLVECLGRTYSYSLTTVLAPLSQSTEVGGVQRSRSTVSLGYTRSLDGFTLSSELADRSFPLFHYALRHERSGERWSGLHGESFEFSHKLGELTVGYGGGVSETKTGRESFLRAYAEAFSYNILLSQRTLRQQQELWISLALPQPLFLRMSYLKRLDGSTTAQIWRTFYIHQENFVHELSLEGVRDQRSQGSLPVHRGSLAHAVRFDRFSLLQPEARWAGECAEREADRCLIEQMSLGLDSRWRQVRVQMLYRLLPHEIFAETEWDFWGQSRLYVQLQKRLLQLNMLEQKPFRQYQGAGSALVLAGLHAERKKGNWLGFIDLSLPYDGWNHADSENVTSGFRYEGSAWVWGSSVRMSGFSRKLAWYASADVRYHFSENLQRAVLRMQDHSLSGTVRENITGVPVADAQILLQDESGRTMSETRTDKQGQYKLSSIPSVGHYYVSASHGTFSDRKVVEKDVEQVSAQSDLELGENVAVDVRFFVDADGDSQFSVGDKPVAIANDVPETQDAIVAMDGAVYVDRKTVIRKNKRVVPKIQKEFLPLGYLFIKMRHNLEDEKQEKKYVEVLLKETK